MIPYFPFTSQPFKREMGLKVLELKDWIEPDGDWEAQTRLKRELLRDHRDTVLAFSDEQAAREPAAELLELLRAHLKEYHPAIYARTSALPQLPPLEHTASLVQEDFCLLEPGSSKLIAGVVCFPSRWKIGDKVGKDSHGVHAPVAQFQSIARPVQASLENLKIPLWRLNWTIHDSGELYCPHPNPRHERIGKEEVLDTAHLRVERQTLRKLPRTGATAFSIRTYVHTIREVISDRDRCASLQATLNSLPEDVARYKGMTYFFTELKQALEELP